MLAKEKSTGSDRLPVCFAPDPHGSAWSCRGWESVLRTASPPWLHFSPKLTSTSEEAWRAESSVQPWA